MSEVSSPEYRNIAFSFNKTPDFQFREECWRNQCANDCIRAHGDAKRQSKRGYNTDIILHGLVIRFMTEHNVTEPPTK